MIVKLGTRENSSKKVTEIMTKIRLNIELKQNLKNSAFFGKTYVNLNFSQTFTVGK